MRIVGLIIVFLSLPVLIFLLKEYPRQRKWAYFAVGMMPFGLTVLNMDASLIDWSGWSGTTKGIIFSLLDTLALAIIVVERTPIRRLPFLGVFVAYFLAAVLSIAFSRIWMSSAFYVFQLLRPLVVYIAVSGMVSRPGAIRWLALGLAVAGIYEGYLTIEQRFSGMFQAIGSMGHQNLLGLTLHFVTLPLIGILLAGERSKIIMFGILGALIAVGLGASRGAITFVSLGIVILFVLSLMRRATAQKWKIFGFGVLAAALFLPIAMNSFSDRFGNGPIYSQDNERVAFANAAKAMWADHPMGIGANQFVVIANTGGYYARAGVHWNPGNRGALVHNMYLLAAAETGWLGLITLLSLLLWPIVCGLRFSFAHRRDPRGDVVLGATVAIMVLAVHGLYEWVFFEVYAQYVFAISLGLIAGTIRQVRLEKARASSSAARASIPGDHVQSRPAASVSIAAK